MSAMCLHFAGKAWQNTILFRNAGTVIHATTTARHSSCLASSCCQSMANIMFPIHQDDRRSGGLAVSGIFLEQRRFKRRQPIVYTKELNFDYSGDLEKIPPLDPKAVVFKYRGLPDLENAPEAVKKLVSLDFADRATRGMHRRYETCRNIAEQLDGTLDREMRIAVWTMEIRNQIPHCLVYRGDKAGKVNLIEKIAQRKKHLKFLRRMDFQRFYWLLHELRIRYTNFPLYHNKQTKRHLRKQAVRQKAHILWQTKMEAFRKSVEASKEEFFKEKDEIMTDIRKDLRSLNLNEKDVFNEFSKSLLPPKRMPVNKNYQRILRNYQKALDSGQIVPKPQMSPVR